MKSKEWSLFHSENQEQFDGLNEAMLRSHLQKYKPKDLDFLYAWCPSFSNWRHLKDISDLKECVEDCILKKEMRSVSPSKSSPLPPPPPGQTSTLNLKPLKNENPFSKEEGINAKEGPQYQKPKLSVVPEVLTSTASSFNVSINKRALEIDNRRQHDRYPIKMRVIIRSKEITFRTFTTNISLGGVALEHPIPEELINSECQILIAGNDVQENIRFTIKLVKSKDGSRFRFDKEERATVQKLQSWIERFVKSQSKLPRTAS